MPNADERAALRALADAPGVALPQYWPPLWVAEVLAVLPDHPDASFIATASPSVVRGLVDAIEAVRWLHREVIHDPFSSAPRSTCLHCGPLTWPCATIQVLERHGA